ncbi:serine hydrolase [Pseudomonas sp. gcc21]|uniref:serine hydrolase domain-containing protein n=1 Tax=Pseudomonas sp. gcc21 TaxID=2726989 RepID=UPI0014524CBD|nr:serine hydrolase [Pseudomonas sp. gcc21]QJD59108.1 serine hydrolase [Pseudomonas sp. gcc21]
MNTTKILGVTLAIVLSSAQVPAVELPDPESVRTDRLQLMEGFPPPAEKQITHAGFMRPYPNPRWSFHHARELFPSRRVARANEGVYVLPRLEGREQQIADLTFAGPDGKPMSFAQYLDSTYVDGVLIMQHGKVLFEQYQAGVPQDEPHILWSVTKSVVGLLATQLIEEGKLDPQALVTDYLPELEPSGWKGATVQQVLNMTADINYSEIYADRTSDVAKYSRAAGMSPQPHDYTGAKDLYSYLPTIGAGVDEHGTAFRYRTTHTETLGWILRRVTGLSTAALIEQRIWSKLGAEQDGYMLLDSKGTEWAGAGFNVTLRDLARFAEMVRLNGEFNGQQVVSPAVIQTIRKGGDREAFKAAGRDFQPGYSYRNQWWISHNDDGAFEALGVHGQMIHINPAVGMVMVRLSSHPVATSAETMPATIAAMEALADLLRPNPD